MANYDARINISANNGPAITAIQEIQNRLDRVNRAAQINFGERVSLGGLERALRTVNQVENAVISLRSTVRSLSAPGGGNLGDAFRVAATEANRFFDSLVRGDRQLSNTISGLNEQARAFATLAANIDSADRRFTDYVQGAQAAQDKGLRPLFRQLEALRRLYQESVTGMGTDIQSPQMGATFFERLRNEVPNTVKALQTYRGELERIQSLIESGSVADIGVQQELLRVEQQLLDIERQRLELRTALRGETSPQVQSALGRMEGRGADPLGVSDDQINESLNARAEQYVRQQRELGSLQQVLGAMEGKRYDPLNVTDEQINAALNERAVQYQKQEEELSSLQRVLSAMEGKRYDPLNISDAQINQGLNERASEYQRQQQELSELQRVLAAMEGQKYDPFGITDSQVNAGLDERAAIYQQQSRDMAALQQALGSMEGKRVDWATVFGIQEADVAARRANELEAEWKKLQAAADALAAQAPQTAAALKAFEFKTRAEDANAYTRALLNQQRTLDEYADSASRAARAASGLGYGGELPALRPAGFTSQDVRIKNLLDDEVKSAQIVADLEMELDKIVTFAEIENVQKAYDYEIDRIEQNLKARIKADDAFWDAAKRNIDENDKRARERERQNALPFLERRFGKRGSAAISEGLIGGAFPLLFGQGLGAAVGGGFGGAVGGFAGGGLGFGLSLIGTALGTAFDTAIQAATEFGAALNDVSTIFDKTKERALFSSREIEKYATKLEEAGLVASASALAQQEIIDKIGVIGAEKLRALESSSDRLNRAWSELNLQLQTALAGPMAGLLEWVANIVGEGNKIRRGYAEIEDIRSRLSDADRKEFDKRASEIEYLSKLPGLNPNRISREEAIQRQVALARSEFAPRAARAQPIKLTPELISDQLLSQAKSQIDSLNARLEATEIGKRITDQLRAAAREQEDLDRQRADLVEGYEKAIADIRLGVERRVTQERQANLATENEIYAKQGEIRLQQLRNENAIISESLRGNELGQELFDIVSQYTEQQLQTENEIASRRRNLEAELQSAAIEVEQYKIDVAKQVADVNQSTAKQIEQIQLNVLRRQQDAAESRFGLEKQIALARLQVERVTAEQEKRKLEDILAGEKDESRRQSLQTSIGNYNAVLTGGGPNSFAAAERAISSAAAPKAPSFAGFAVGARVSTAAFDAVIASGNQLKANLESLRQSFDELVAAGNIQALNSRLADFADQGAAKANQALTDLVNLAVFGVDPLGSKLGQIQEVIETISGSNSARISPELKELVSLYGQLASENLRLARTSEFFESQISSNVESINSLKEEINDATAGTTEYEKALARLTAYGLNPASEGAEALLRSASELDRLQDKIAVINRIRDAASGFSDSLRGLIEDFAELGSASEAVKSFTDKLGKQALGFVLDIAFKPIQETMQKQFFSFAESLGIDIKPEAIKQLDELSTIRQNVTSINEKIAALTGAGSVKFSPAGDNTSVSINGLTGLVSNSATEQQIADLVKIAVQNGVINGFQSQFVKAELDRYFSNLNKNYFNSLPTERYTPGAGATGSYPPGTQESQKLYPGLGGPDLPDSVLGRASFPYDPDADLPSPSELKGLAPATQAATDAIVQLPPVVNKASQDLNKANTALQAGGSAWTRSLGQVVTGLAGASAAVIGITGGIQQVKSGGTYEVLSGLAGIFGGIASVTGMFGTGGIFSGVFGGGGGGGSIAPGPVAQSAGVTYSPGYYGPAFRAAGGPVASGSPYIVGEVGPELFIPDSDGFIVPNDKIVIGGDSTDPTPFASNGELLDEVDGGTSAGALGSSNSSTSNIFTGGSSSSTSNTFSTINNTKIPFVKSSESLTAERAEREMLSAVVNPKPLDVRFESTVINQVEYVTAEQHRKGMAEAAERGRTLTLSALQNSVKSRKKVGLA